MKVIYMRFLKHSLPVLFVTTSLFVTPLMAKADPAGAPAPLPNTSGAPPAAQPANAAAPPATEQAQGEAPPDFSDALTGDWGGLRTKLANDGLTFTGVYHADFWRNFSGGIKTGNSYLDDIDLQISGDGEKLYGLKGSSFFIYGLNNAGSRVNENLVGSAGGIDNLEVLKARPKLFEAWVQQNFFDDRLSLLGGLYATDTEFEITDSSVLFINPALGTSTEFGAAGVAGPAAFPESSAGGRVLVKPFTDTYVQAAVVGGHPADPGDPNGLQFGYGSNAGLILLGEAGYKNDDNGHYGLGVWHFTRGFDDFDGSSSGRARKGDTGYYALADRALLTDPAVKGRTLSGFIRLGAADNDVSPFSWSWATGVSAANILPSRPDSQAGFAVNQTKVSGDFRDAVTAAGGSVGRTETQFELTYADKPIPWLTVQPDLQYTINPALDPDRQNALTAGVRAVVNF